MVRYARRGGLPVAIEWPGADGREARRVEMGFLASAPGAAADIAEALARLTASDFNEQGILGKLSALKLGLVRYLSGTPARRRLRLAALDAKHVAGLVDMLRRDGRLADPSRTHYYGAARWLLRRVPGAVVVPECPFESARPRRSRSVAHADLSRVFTAAVRDALLRMARHRALADGAHPLWADPAAARWLALVRALKAAFPGARAPNPGEVDARCPHLRAEFDAMGLAELRTWWGPCLSNLGAFTLMLLYFFRLNVSMVATMGLNEIARVRDDVRVGKFKKRSRRRQTPGYPHGDERMGPEVIRTFLKEWTADARAAAPEADRSRLVVCWRYKGPARPTTTLGPRMSVTKGFEALQRSYGLPAISPAMLRPTGIDVVDRATDGDVEMVAGTGQHLPTTSRASYRTVSAVRREQARLGVAQMVRRRDYRVRLAAAAPGRVGSTGVRAATPGWFCRNPLFRLFSEAGEGEMCDAVGKCPVCPMGRPDLGCPYSRAHTVALREAVAAKVEGGDRQAVGEWQPVADRLDVHWLPSFEPAVLAAPMPRVPSLVGAL